MLFPEVGRLLAYKGAEILVAQGACRDMTHYHKLRAGIMATAQDNQLFSAASFLVGHMPFNQQEEQQFVGKSAILAPPPLTSRFNGVVVEMGNPRSEGVLSASWNFSALKTVWETAASPVRRELPAQHIEAAIAALQANLQVVRLENVAATASATGQQDEAQTQVPPAREPMLQLDDLLVNNTVTRRWPLAKLDYTSFVRTQGTPDMPPLLQAPMSQSALQSGRPTPANQERHKHSSLAEDETEEMDAVPGDNGDS